MDWVEGFLQQYKQLLTQRYAKNISQTRAATAGFLLLISEIMTKLILSTSLVSEVPLFRHHYPERFRNSSRRVSFCGNVAEVAPSSHVHYTAEKIWTMCNGTFGSRHNRTKSDLFDGQTFED